MSKRKPPVVIEELHGYSIQVHRRSRRGALPQFYVMIIPSHGEAIGMIAHSVNHALYLGRDYVISQRANLMPFYPESLR